MNKLFNIYRDPAPEPTAGESIYEAIMNDKPAEPAAPEASAPEAAKPAEPAKKKATIKS